MRRTRLIALAARASGPRQRRRVNSTGSGRPLAAGFAGPRAARTLGVRGERPIDFDAVAVGQLLAEGSDSPENAHRRTREATSGKLVVGLRAAQRLVDR